MKRNVEFIKSWIDALRSGKYQQGTGTLRKGDCYCCLGVAASLIDSCSWEFTQNNKYQWRSTLTACLDDDSLKHIGLAFVEERRLARMNDNGSSFDEIADYLQNHILTTQP